MNEQRFTDMKIPVRPAPAPPTTRPTLNGREHRGFVWNDRTNGFTNVPQFTNQNMTNSTNVCKKKPPPRPPPPKFNQQKSRKQGFAKPSELITGLFSRRSNSQGNQVNQKSRDDVVKPKDSFPVASLIDLDSPSCSPTFTTRSSSDGVSINSFGSDGSASNNAANSGYSTIFESGFEDDFDFFSGLSNSSSISGLQQKDPWGSCDSPDPFSPPPTSQQLPHSNTFPFPKEGSSAVWFDSISQTEVVKASSQIQSSQRSVHHSTSLPTIIRPKISNRTPQVQASGTSTSLTKISKPAFELGESLQSLDSSGFGEDTDDWSLPMPSGPPPPPPPEIFMEDFPSPLLPPRPTSEAQNLKEPQAIAIYDYSGTHPDDLSFQANDVIFLTKQINSDWYCGRTDNREGMFPANFVNVVVPLSESLLNQKEPEPTYTVKALYTFLAESWEDLEFPEGATITVLKQLNSDWLYGEYNGNRGQFPASFVDHIPTGLPNH